MNPSTKHPDMGNEENEINLAPLVDAILFERVLVLSIAAFVAAIAGLYALFAMPVYRAEIMIQIEDNGGGLGKNLLGDVSSLFETKTSTSAEMEILRSRTLASYVVDSQHLDFSVTPHYFPLIGEWVAKRRDTLSGDSDRPFGGYAWGGEIIDVGKFKVPQGTEGTRYTLVATDATHYRLSAPAIGLDVSGETGRAEVWKTPMGEVEFQLTALRARPGTEFSLVHFSHQKAVADLQKRLAINEKGKLSGILNIELEDEDPGLAARMLNTLGSRYVQQNTERKAAEAEKSLEFLAQVLPHAKKNLERAEERFVSLRNERGTVDLAEEAKLILERSAELRTKETMLRIKRDELLKNFTPLHPEVEAIDAQLVSTRAEAGNVDQLIKQRPGIEREVIGLTRDVKLNAEVFTNLMNSAQQLQLAKAGKVGNARVIDYADVPELPVKPRRGLLFLLSVAGGLLLGVAAALAKRYLRGGVEDAHEIEQATGLSVYANVPLSEQQAVLSEKIKAKVKENLLLAHVDTHDGAIESLRSLRTALQFAMLEAKNKIVIFSGTAPGIGKSFVSANFAGVMASAGKRVLLIDLDLRKGHLNQYLGLPRENGLSELIAGERKISQVLIKDVLPHLDFIATGTLPANPNDILLNSKLHSWLERWAANYDMVILDTPPILAVSDPSVLAPQAGALLLVVREGQTSLAEVHESVKRFTQAGTSVTGVLMNGVRARLSPYGYGSKRYRYTSHAYDSYRPQPGQANPE